VACSGARLGATTIRIGGNQHAVAAAAGAQRAADDFLGVADRPGPCRSS
jgi:hypothetical protein